MLPGQLCNIPLDPCMSSPCRNGATCAVVGPARQFRCICPAGFTGNQCQNEIEGSIFRKFHLEQLK